MVDRADIDALLISALYGELAPADEARLTLHLDTHPADKSALGLLTETRAAFRASGFTGVQVDPPQAISALLLQEAARRAPKPVRVDDRAQEPGWFARFFGSFAKHPAMAAAMMLVLVAGVGGLLYSHQGSGGFADQKSSASAGSAVALTGSTAMEQQTPPALDQLQEGYRVDLADSTKRDNATAAAGSGSAAGFGGVMVTTPAAVPKDLEESKLEDKMEREKEKEKERDKDTQRVAHTEAPIGNQRRGELALEPQKNQKVAGPGAKGDGTVVVDPAAAPGMIATAPMTGVGGGNGAPPNVDVAPAQVTKPPPPAPPKATVAKGGAGNGETALLAWAKDQHARVVSFVRDNDCPSAAKIAGEIATRATDYYNANVVNDRALKACQAYFTEQREKDAERTNKARAAKKIDANEVQPAPAGLQHSTE